MTASEGIVQRIKGVIESAVDRFQDRIRGINVFIEDVNGPRGGIDKQCRCVLRVNKMSPIVIQDKDENLENMMFRVANRVAYAMSQKIDRRYKRPRKGRID